MPNSYRKMLNTEELFDLVAIVESPYDSFRFWVDEDDTLYEVGMGYMIQDEEDPYINTIDGFEDEIQYLLKYRTPINRNASLKNIDVEDVEILDLQVEQLMDYDEICEMLMKKCNIKMGSHITKARIPNIESVTKRGLYPNDFSDEVWKNVKRIKE